MLSLLCTRLQPPVYPYVSLSSLSNHSSIFNGEGSRSKKRKKLQTSEEGKMLRSTFLFISSSFFRVFFSRRFLPETESFSVRRHISSASSQTIFSLPAEFACVDLRRPIQREADARLTEGVSKSGGKSSSLSLPFSLSLSSFQKKERSKKDTGGVLTPPPSFPPPTTPFLPQRPNYGDGRSPNSSFRPPFFF